MPLRDHFHPPVNDLLEWDTLHSGWASQLTELLNERAGCPRSSLPKSIPTPGEGWKSTWRPSSGRTPHLQSALPRARMAPRLQHCPNSMSRHRLPEPCPASSPTISRCASSVPAAATDSWPRSSWLALVTRTGPTSGAPSRPSAPPTFNKASAWSSLTWSRIGAPNLHNEIIRLMQARDEYLMPPENNLYAVSYRPVLRGESGDRFVARPVGRRGGAADSAAPINPRSLRAGRTGDDLHGNLSQTPSHLTDLQEPNRHARQSPDCRGVEARLQGVQERLKVTRIDAESSIAGGPLSSGRRSDIVAISPPAEFPQAVWDALVKQGKLKSAGRGMYELVEQTGN